MDKSSLVRVHWWKGITPLRTRHLQNKYRIEDTTSIPCQYDMRGTMLTLGKQITAFMIIFICMQKARYKIFIIIIMKIKEKTMFNLQRYWFITHYVTLFSVNHIFQVHWGVV